MIVIKSLGSSAPEGAKKLYRDALVENGSLFLVDFSNKGTLNNFSVENGAKVFDLSRESSNTIGIQTEGIVETRSDLVLTPGKGFTAQYLEEPAYDQIMKFPGSLNGYLTDNQPNSICIVWARFDPDYDPAVSYGNQLIRTREASDRAITNLRVNFTEPGPTIVFGGSGVGGGSIDQVPGDLMQIAIEYKGVGVPANVWANGLPISGATDATGFVAADRIEFGNSETSEPNPAAIYRALIEDLSVSGRTAEEVIQKDWDYVHAVGEFEGIVKRPFVDAY